MYYIYYLYCNVSHASVCLFLCNLVIVQLYVCVSYSLVVQLFDAFVALFFFFKQKTAYEMRISDWSSDVCSSDLLRPGIRIIKITLECLRPAVGRVDDADVAGIRQRGRMRDRRDIDTTAHRTGTQQHQQQHRPKAAAHRGESSATRQLRIMAVTPQPRNRSEERSGGQEGGSKCKSRGVPDH